MTQLDARRHRDRAPPDRAPRAAAPDPARSTATPTSSPCTSTPRRPSSTPTSYEIGGNRAAKDLNNAAIRQSTSTGTSVHPDQIRVAHRAAGRAGAADVVRHLLQRLPGVVLAPLDASSARSPDRHARAARGASVTVYKSMANGRSQRVDAATVERRRRARRSPST